jgi:hypothetical protein
MHVRRSEQNYCGAREHCSFQSKNDTLSRAKILVQINTSICRKSVAVVCSNLRTYGNIPTDNAWPQKAPIQHSDNCNYLVDEEKHTRLPTLIKESNSKEIDSHNRISFPLQHSYKACDKS